MFMGLLTFFASLIIPGIFLFRLIARTSVWSFIGLASAYALGSSFVAISLFFYFFIFHFSASPYLNLVVWLPALMLWGLDYFIYRRGRLGKTGLSPATPGRASSGLAKLSVFKKIALAIIGIIFLLNLLVLFGRAISQPAASFDSLSMWSFKAKAIFFQSSVDFNADSPLYLGGGGHINYPWQIPLLQYWLSFNVGAYDDLRTNWIFIIYFFALLAVMFSFFKERLGYFQAIILSFFFFSLPLVFYHASNAYADLPLALYLVLAAVYFYRWLESKRREEAVLAGVFLGLSFWIKDAAILFLPAFIPAAWLGAGRRLFCRQILGSILAAVLAAAPWLAFKAAYGLGFANVAPGLVFHPAALLSLLASMFVSYSWNIWWFIVLFFALLSLRQWPRNRGLVFTWSLFFFSWLILMLVFVFTNAYQYASDQTAVSRSLIPLAGLSFLAVGLSIKDRL